MLNPRSFQFLLLNENEHPSHTFFFLNQGALKHIVLPLCPKQDQEMAFHAAPISHYEMSVMSRPAFHLPVVTKLSLGWNFCGQAWPWEDQAVGGWKPLSTFGSLGPHPACSRLLCTPTGQGEEETRCGSAGCCLPQPPGVRT